MNSEQKPPPTRRWVNPYISQIENDSRIFQFAENALATDDRVNFERYRAKHSKVICELGSGSGGHIVERAAETPDALFVGFELRFKRAAVTIAKAEKMGLRNVILFRGRAELLPDLFEANSLDGVYVNFPDPWEKRRWRKHRLLNEQFLQVLFDRIKPEGFFSFKTDHQEYFESAKKDLEGLPQCALQAFSSDLKNSEFALGNIRTEFEKLFNSKGLPIFWLSAKKMGTSPTSSYNKT
jgi:tRNA (guanine-N7-)-methyltransferase